VHAIWYRHWLELRLMLAIMCGLALVASLGYGFAVAGMSGYFSETGRLTKEIARYEGMRQLIPTPHLVPWAVHTLIVGFLALFGASSFHGTALTVGPGAAASWINTPSVYYTASLPLSRYWLAGSRIAAGVACVVTVLAVSLVGHWLALLVISQPIPLIAMTKTSLLGAGLALGLVAISAVIGLAVSESISGLMIFAMTMVLWLSRDGWNGVLQFVSGSWAGAPVAVIAASLLAIAVTMVLVRRREL